MAVFWVLAAAIFVSTVLLAVVCLHCGHKGPPVSIRQGTESEDYTPSTQFRVAHPSLTNTNVTSMHLLPLYLPSVDPGSFVPSETESYPSYENPADGLDYIYTDSDAEDPGYIIVLPEVETPRTNQSRASTPSSDVRHDYENVPEKKDSDYLNVETLHFERSTIYLSAKSDDEDEDDSDEDEGNYVNVHDGNQTDGPQ